MKFDCLIKEIQDDDEVTIQIGDVIITGFVNMGIDSPIDKKAQVDIEFYDDIELEESNVKEKCIISTGTFAYSIFGVLDVDNGIIKSALDFEIDSEYLFDYGFLDGKYVELKVIRLDFSFEN